MEITGRLPAWYIHSYLPNQLKPTREPILSLSQPITGALSIHRYRGKISYVVVETFSAVIHVIFEFLVEFVYEGTEVVG